MTLYTPSAQTQVQFCHPEATAHVKPFTPAGKSRAVLSLGGEAEVFLALKYPVQDLEGVGLMNHVRGKST